MRTLQSISAFLLINVFVYTLLGIEFFSHRAKINVQTDMVDTENGESPMFNFDTFMNSFYTTFTVLTNDGQSGMFYNFYRAVSPS